ncbi:MAG: geranylgeranyl reductase family protein [Thermoleophilia bacterium]
MPDCEVLVIGAGPAGSVAAAAAAREGADVILLERRRVVGQPVQCAEHLPLQTVREFGLGATDVVVQYIEAMRTHLPDGQVVVTPARGAICHRDRFDRHLAALAESAGARLMTGTRASGYDGGVVTAVAGEKQFQLRPAVIVGADGPCSRVRKWMGSGSNEFVNGGQHQLPLARELNTTEIFFRRYIPGGYGWLFPKGDMANVGVGVDRRFGVTPSRALKMLTAELIETGFLRANTATGATGGLIPVSGMTRVRMDNMILAGDAAGHCHPVTGAGVPSAIFAGRMAGEAAARAAAAGDPELLGEYEESCSLFIRDSWEQAVEKRRLLNHDWQKDDRELSRSLKKNWIAFKEYYED